LFRLLAFAMLGFQLWMVVDAHRRSAETYWLWIILGVPGGALLYLVMVRLRDRDAQAVGHKILRFLASPTPLSELELRFRESPSIANRLILAQGLGDAGRYGDAEQHFSAVLTTRPGEVDALFGLGVCRLEQGDANRAVEPLLQVVTDAPLYRDFAAYPELTSALMKSGRAEQARELLADFAKRYPRLPNVVLFSKHLIQAGEVEAAHERLRLALRDFKSSPRYVRRLYRRAAAEAKALLAAPAPSNTA
jgi:hypothetical protein